jgi:hypothetical protein
VCGIELFSVKVEKLAVVGHFDPVPNLRLAVRTRFPDKQATRTLGNQAVAVHQCVPDPTILDGWSAIGKQSRPRHDEVSTGKSACRKLCQRLQVDHGYPETEL